MLKELHSARAPLARPAVFLDRDGTLNVEKNYLFRFADWEWEKGAVAAIRLLQHHGYFIVVVTNQSGIARGYYAEADVQLLHDQVQDDLTRSGARIDAFYSCPHHPEITGPCLCRKPGTQMLFEAARDLNIDLQNSWIIGDKLTDLEAGQACGLACALVRTGYGSHEEKKLRAAGKRFRVFDRLLDAAHDLLATVRN